MAQPLQKLRPTGITVDIPASEVGADQYTNGDNVVFRDGFAERAKGWGPLFSTLEAVPEHLVNVTYQGVNYWIACCTDSIWVTPSSTLWTDITPAGFAAAGPSTDISPWTHCQR
jgi:hypothetical protein